MSERSDIGDGEILRETKKSLKDGKVQLRFKLPSGRDVVSEWMDPDMVKGRVLIKWGDLIRGEHAADLEEKAQQEIAKLKAPREPEQSTSVPPSKAAGATTGGSEPTSTSLSEPLEYARGQVTTFTQKKKELEDKKNKLLAELDKVAAGLEGWSKILAGLDGTAKKRGRPPKKTQA